MEQQIQFCTTDDGVRIAYATVGQGPPLLKAANWLSHLEFDWRSPVWRHLLAEFARDHTFIRYDERGNGLSDWNVADLSFDAWVEDLDSVVEAAGLDHFPLLGISQGGAVAIAYAVRHPEKVSHLILYGAYARGWAKRESAEEIEQRQAALTLVRLGWGKDNPAFRQLWTTLYAPDASPEQAQSFNDLQRVSTSPENAVTLLSVMGNIDVVDLLAQVKVPTLVLHCRDEAGVPVEEGRLIASSIPGARFVPLKGRNHLLLEGDPSWGAFVKEVRQFLGTEETSAMTQISESSDPIKPNLQRSDLPERYTIISFLGVGGMGEVYLAEDTKLGRKVALKTLPAEFTNDKERLRRFQQEARAASALNHPNLLTIHEIGAEGGAHFIAAEYIDGETLRAQIKHGGMKIDDVLDVGQQTAFALTAAHEAGIVHRDIKPENIMVRRDGIVKVLDFGLAKLLEDRPRETIDHEADTRALVLTDPGRVLGTPAYMSPEQARGFDLDARTDIWSLGVVLYEMAAGRAPFRGETKSHTVVSILETEPPPLTTLAPDTPAELQRIVRKALTKDRDSRYQTARDLMIDLKNLRRDLDVQSELRRSAQAGSHNLSEGAAIKAGITASPTAHTNSIAILAFANMSNDPENEYFCDGLAEEILNAMAKIEDLKVAARTSAFSFKGKNAEVSEIARALNVKTVLEGSVRKSGDRLRINVQLIDAASGYQVWSERYDRAMQDIFDVQDEIALAVVGALKMKLLGEEKATILKRYTANTDAYQTYLRGRFFWNKRNSEGFQKALESFKAAIDLDPNYALAYAGLADSYAMLGAYGVLPESDSYPQAKMAATTSLTFDPMLAEAHTSLALILHSYDWDWAAAEAEFKRAIELNPNYATAHHWYAMYLTNLGRFEEAEAENKRALELDPLSLIINANRGLIFFAARKYDEAIQASQRAIELDPSFYTAHADLGREYAQKGEYPKALAAFKRARELDDDPAVVAFIGYTHAVAGNLREAKKILRELKDSATRTYVSPFFMATVYTGVGDSDNAFEWLEKALTARSFWLLCLGSDPEFDSLRSDRRYAGLMRRIGLAAGEELPGGSTSETKRAPLTILSATRSLSEAPAAATSLAETRPTSSDPQAGEGSIRYRVTALVAMLLLAVTTLGIWYYFQRQDTGAAIESIVVLPFVNTGNDPNAEYLSDGIAESLTNNLSQLPNLKVMSRNTAFQYKGKDQTAPKVGKDLNVRAVVTGSVKQLGDQIVISVSLDDALDSRHIWGEQYNRKVADILAVQEDIAREISAKLRLKLSGEAEKYLTRRYTDNVEAYQLYLKGRFELNRFTPEGFQRAAAYYNQAIAIDQSYALAYAGLSEIYGVESNFGASPKEAYPKAELAANKALALDDRLAEGHAALAEIKLFYAFDFPAAAREYKRALELNPNYAEAYSGYSGHLKAMRRYDEEIAEAKRGQALDPLSAFANMELGEAYYHARRYDEAIDQITRTLQMDPNLVGFAYHVRARAYEQKKMYAAAIADCQQWLKGNPDGEQALATLGHIYAAMGNRLAAQDTLEKLQSISKQRYISSYWFAVVYAGLGDNDKAFQYLDKAFDERYFLVIWINGDPRLDSLHSDRRFADLLLRIGLPQ